MSDTPITKLNLQPLDDGAVLLEFDVPGRPELGFEYTMSPESIDEFVSALLQAKELAAKAASDLSQ